LRWYECACGKYRLDEIVVAEQLNTVLYIFFVYSGSDDVSLITDDG